MLLDNHLAFNPAAREGSQVRPLTDEEVEAFVDDLDHNNDGYIAYDEVEAKLDAVHAEIQPEARPHNLHHDSTGDAERHAFLREILGSDEKRIPRAEFAARVKEWRIPSLQQEQEDEESQDAYMRRIGVVRRTRSYLAVHGPTIVFMCVVVGMMLAFGIWQLVKYLGPAYSGALGWGVVVAKTCAGMLYPTLFFLLLSMAREFSTLLRRSYRVSRFINWDLSQEFHIYMAITATCLGTLHGIAHLAGDFVWIANSYRPEPLDNLLGTDRSGLHSYRDLIKSRPGITGILALFFFYVIGLASTPWIRKRSYEVFQLAHLLMYPVIGCLMAHGTQAILQWPMLGYFLAFPTLLVLCERVHRVAVGFHRISGTIRILDAETVEVKATIPKGRIFDYSAGQYLFLQVPQLSLFQWHPFTISGCQGRQISLHIKTDGNWTNRLRSLATNGSEETPVKIGIDGPFGAPAQRFNDFSHTILVGSGIGVTPFSGILADLQAKHDREYGLGGGPEGLDEKEQRSSAPASRRNSGRGDSTPRDDSAQRQDSADTATPGDSSEKPHSPLTPYRPHERKGSQGSLGMFRVPSARSLSRSRSRLRNPGPPEFAHDYRRVDMHWIVRDQNSLHWFSDLLNTICRSQRWFTRREGREGRRDSHPAATHEEDPTAHPTHLDIRIQTHVTQKRKDIATHVYRWLLELHRTKSHPESPLTGLINPTHFGRPDFVRILDDHYADMLRYRAQFGFDRNNDGRNDRFKVGVFFCGAPVVGEMIADRCRVLTARGRKDETRIEYYFMMEVFA